MTAGDSHLFGGASSGASWCIDGILCCKNKILGNEFDGCTAHHLGNIVKHLQHILASLVSDAVLLNGRLCYWRIETVMSVQFPLP
jgi:hypothetical protein